MDTVITSYHSGAEERKVTFNTVNKKIKLKGVPFPVIQTTQKGDSESWENTIVFDEKDIPEELTDDDILSEIGMESYYTAPGYGYAHVGIVKRKNGNIFCSQNGGLDI